MSSGMPGGQGPTSPHESQSSAPPGGYGQPYQQQSFGQPQVAQQQYPPPGMPPQGYGAAGGFPETRPAARVVGPILMIVGALAALIGTILPWNYRTHWEDSPDGGITPTKGEAWNGFEQMQVNMDAGRTYGTLMMVAFIVALAACAAVIIAAIGTFARAKGKGMGVLAVIGAILGLVATLGMLIGYLALGATNAMGVGTWVFGLSFILVFLGALGVRSQKY